MRSMSIGAACPSFHRFPYHPSAPRKMPAESVVLPEHRGHGAYVSCDGHADASLCLSASLRLDFTLAVLQAARLCSCIPSYLFLSL